MPTMFLTDAGGTPIWNPDYLASEPTLIDRAQTGGDLPDQPESAWYDGTPITWEDFHWQWKASNGTNKAYQISSSNGYADIENVARGNDDREVIVTFKNHYADWQALFTRSTRPRPTRAEDLQRRLEGSAADDRRTVQARGHRSDREDHHAGPQREMVGRPGQTRHDRVPHHRADAQIDALANGEIDSMDVGPDANKYSRAKEIAGTDMRVAGGPNFRHITINGTAPILQDVKVRQALAMAIDRPAIARALLGPLGVDPRRSATTSSWATRRATRTTPATSASSTRPKPGSCWTRPGGRSTATCGRRTAAAGDQLVIPAAVATSQQESELMQNMLGQVGVKLRINTVPSPDFFEKYIRPGQFDFTVFSWIGTPYPISSSRSIYAKPK